MREVQLLVIGGISQGEALAQHRLGPVETRQIEISAAESEIELRQLHQCQRTLQMRDSFSEAKPLVGAVAMSDGSAYLHAGIYRDFARGPAGMFLFGEMLLFIALLAVGYVYVWKKKAFDW